VAHLFPKIRAKAVLSRIDELETVVLEAGSNCFMEALDIDDIAFALGRLLQEARLLSSN
jgi:hypothetical protein